MARPRYIERTALRPSVLGVAAGMTLHRDMIPRMAFFAGNGTPPCTLRRLLKEDFR